MEQIPLMFVESKETETLLGPAIQAGLEALKVHYLIIKINFIYFHYCVGLCLHARICRETILLRFIDCAI